MEISTLSRNAGIAQSEGWITIERAARGNGRVLSLTPSGRQKLLDALPQWEQAQEEARTLLGPEGADALWNLGNSAWDDQAGHTRARS
jgi:DNA-binding PadR family transcriptional regulator